MGGRRPGLGAAYLGVLVAVFAVLSWTTPELLFLLFLAYPQVWFVVRTTSGGVAWTIALALASTVGPAIHWTQGTEPLAGVLQTVVGLTFSVAIGVWFSRVME